MNRISKALSGLFAGCALACTAAAAHAQPAPATPAAAADEAPVDPARLALARQLVGLVKEQLDFGAVFKTVGDQMATAMQQADPKADPAIARRAIKAIGEAEEQIMPQIWEAATLAYARDLTETELKDSIAFYSSPSGQSIIHKMPQMMREMTPAIMRLVPQMIVAAAKASCSEGGCTPAQQQMMDAMVARADAMRQQQR
jgi:hypothetical protein